MHGSNKNCIFGSDKFSLPALFLHIGGASSFLALSLYFFVLSDIGIKVFATWLRALISSAPGHLHSCFIRVATGLQLATCSSPCLRCVTCRIFPTGLSAYTWGSFSV